MSSKPKILIVEDNADIQDSYDFALKDRTEILAAYTIEEGRKLFRENPDIQIIVMDACVPGAKPTTIPLVREFRQTFKGPIIAASSIDLYRRELMRTGCSHNCIKDEVAVTVKDLLKSQDSRKSLIVSYSHGPNPT